jgi:ubiquinone biosynthesis protein COQ9
MIIEPTSISSGIVTAVKDRLQVQHDIGGIISQGNADAWQALPQCYSPNFIAISLATAV